MKPYFLLVSFCYFIANPSAFAQFLTTEPYPERATSADKAMPGLDPAYPAIKLTPQLAAQLFVDKKQNLLNCPILFSNDWDYPNGSSIALCDDAQLACLRYGLIIQELKKATGKYREELQKTLALSKNEVKLRLRGCHLVIKETISGKSMQEAAGYPSNSYGSSGPYGPAAQ